MTTDRKLPAEVEAALADHAVQTACAATGIAPASRADAAYERLASAILDALDREREVKACECSPEEACAYLTRAVAAEALLTEARAWGEEQRRQASEHYERAETAEAALSEAREALRECAALFDGQGGTLCDGHTTGDGNGGCTWHHSPSCRKCSVLARARRVLASTVEGNSKLDANSETNRE